MPLRTPGRRAALLVLAAGCALSAGASWGPPITANDRPTPVGGPLLGTDGTVRAPGSGTLPAAVTASAFVVADARTGDVLAARAPHRELPSASTMKALTALTVIREVPLDRQVTVLAPDLAVECTCVGLAPYQVYTVDALLHAALLRSGNDAANVLASATGDRSITIAAMNDLATRLRADDTHAVTPSGLDAPGQHTSAYDLALIIRAGLADARFRRYFNAPAYAFGPVHGSRRTLATQNVLRRLNYPGQLGGKDGWTTPARHTFVGAAERGGRTLVVSVLGADRSYGTQATALLDWGFAQGSHTGVGTLAPPRSDAELRGATPAARPPSQAPHAPPQAPRELDERSPDAHEAAAEPSPKEVAMQADVDPLAREEPVTPEPLARPVPAPENGPSIVDRHLPFPAQASLSLGAVLCTGLALAPGRRPRPTRPGGAPRPPARTARSRPPANRARTARSDQPAARARRSDHLPARAARSNQATARARRSDEPPNRVGAGRSAQRATRSAQPVRRSAQVAPRRRRESQDAQTD